MTNKLKGLLIVICCAVSAFWAEVQGADEEKDQRGEPAKSISFFAGERPLAVSGEESFPITANFDVGEVGNEKLGRYRLKCSILCLRPYGLYPNVDIPNILNAERELTEWGVKINLLEVGSKYYNKFHGNFAALSGFFAPDFQFSDNKMRSLMYLNTFLFIFDDIVDNIYDHRSNFREIIDVKTAVENFISIFKGKYKSLVEIPIVNFPLYIPLCKSILDIQENSVKHIPNYQSNNTYFLKDMITYLNGTHLEFSEFSERENKKLTESTYLFIRQRVSAVPVIFEFIVLMKEIYLDRKIRKSMLFNRLKEAGNNAISIANDMLSLRKEINFNEVTNLVLVKVNRKGMKLDEAFKHVNIFLNDEIEDVAEIGHKLRNLKNVNQITDL